MPRPFSSLLSKSMLKMMSGPEWTALPQLTIQFRFGEPTRQNVQVSAAEIGTATNNRGVKSRTQSRSRRQMAARAVARSCIHLRAKLVVPLADLMHRRLMDIRKLPFCPNSRLRASMRADGSSSSFRNSAKSSLAILPPLPRDHDRPGAEPGESILRTRVKRRRNRGLRLGAQ